MRVTDEKIGVGDDVRKSGERKIEADLWVPVVRGGCLKVTVGYSDIYEQQGAAQRL